MAAGQVPAAEAAAVEDFESVEEDLSDEPLPDEEELSVELAGDLLFSPESDPESDPGPEPFGVVAEELVRLSLR